MKRLPRSSRRSGSVQRHQSGDHLYQVLEPRRLLALDATGVSQYQPTAIVDVFSYDSVNIESLIGRTEHRPYVEGELVVAMEFPKPTWGPQLAPHQLAWDKLTGVKGTRAFL